MQREQHGDVALIRMNAGKANAMSTAFLDRLGELLDALQQPGQARAVVLTGYDRFFSGGLDLPALLALDRAGMAAFMGHFGRAMLRVFTLPVPVVAAINGHAMAGGCVLALQADQRIMAAPDHSSKTAKIGLSEVQIGLGLPAHVLETLRLQVPATSLRPIALEGRLLLPAEALALGLIDEVVPAAELEARALAVAQSLASLSQTAFAQVKLGLRGPVVQAIQARQAAEDARWLETWFSAEAQEHLRAIAARLSGS